MRFDYSEFSGDQGFLSPDELFAPPNLMNFILQYGEQAMDAMANLEDEEEQAFIQQLIDAGLLEESTDEDGNRRLKMSPRLLRGLQHRALLEVFAEMKQGAKEGHSTREPGRTSERSDGTRPYRFGDPIGELDLPGSLQNAARRQVHRAVEEAREAGVEVPRGLRLPIGITPEDFQLHNTEGSADCATVMLIDLSGSMMRYGRFLQAKRVALGMSELIRGRFPLDTLQFVGFSSLAETLHERDLPLVMPKPVSIRDSQVRLRIPLEQAYANQEKIPLHFTNLQLGLRQARQILSRSGAANKQIFIVTDGQPTAHVTTHPATREDMLYLVYPPSDESSELTLREALRCQQRGIRIASFALMEDYWGMDWVGFIEKLTRLTRGTAFYCTSEDLASTVVESYLTGKKSKKFIH
ncbi:vWA domain-containing protein [Phycisphaera mikurensis]|uniref:VWFA domain-containing protein n=1 Tax=Phycisphaera mikurensis (strain NBRC 102666 / KCTC 22515 / FYK2301M01) TaxID=1142394 RepID=I0IGR5_PHYMF|nr:VWA domain-containing protein [Phycisphaera mikurensis]MBB6443242.1 uncharacterized protein with von Willebrand factor type A (vWA) domain [Phycisphaera mikurensis]BAM04453.1 hypothetical protein PSMK_22940 [Phycisphaera mikurensis NBRC 102666]